MSSEADVKFEIGHVLFIDIVGYSKLLIHEQSERLQKLREIARGTEQFRAAQAEGKLLRLPTGDGGALVFSDTHDVDEENMPESDETGGGDQRSEIRRNRRGSAK